MALRIGTLVAGKYRVERELGAGGMGAVYVATNERLGKQVALKVLGESIASSPDAVARFTREAIAASRVKHPGIVEIYDADVHDGQPWIAMELLSGESLGARLERGPLPLDEALDIALETLETLGTVHRAGIVHRDLKPDNVFLENLADGRRIVKILDFGIAKLQGSELGHATATGMVLGTPFFLAPEQARNTKDTDERADVYAMGVILYYALTLALPYDATTFGELVAQMFTQGPRPLASVAPGLPAELCAIVDGCLAVDRNRRVASAGELRRQLLALRPRPRAEAPPSMEEAADRERYRAPEAPAAAPPRPAPPPIRPRAVSGAMAAILGVAGVAVLAIVTGIAWMVWGTVQEEDDATLDRRLSQRGLSPVDVEAPATPEASPVEDAPPVEGEQRAEREETISPAAAEKRVVLDVRASTWREYPPFDIGRAVTDQLRTTNVDVVPAESSSVDGRVLVEYTESRGAAYVGTYRDTHGTNVRLRISVTPTGGRTQRVLELTSNPPFSVQGDLYEVSLRSFQSWPGYAFAGAFAGAAAGGRTAMGQLLPALLWQETRQEALAVLDRARFEPSTAREEAMLALGRLDFDACVGVGSPAVEPLLEVLGRWHRDRNRREPERAASALGRIADPRASPGLMEALRALLENSYETPQTRRTRTAVIEALGAAGDADALGELDRLALHHDATGEVARRSAERVRARLAGSGTASPPP